MRDELKVVETLLRQAHRLDREGKHEEETAVYDEVVKRFGESAEAALKKQVAKALVNKGFTLGQLGKPEDGRQAARLAMQHEPGSEAVRQLAAFVLSGLEADEGKKLS